MGLFDSFLEWLGIRRQKANILVVGLDNSGKTSILNLLIPEDNKSVDIVPTIGFNIEQFSRNGLSLTAFDMSGQSRYRTLWANYYSSTHGIIFVVDSSDKTRILVAREEFQQLLSHRDISPRNVPILIFANKMDVRDALSDVAVSSALGLEGVINKSWHICSSNALSGEGVADGITWLCLAIKDSLGKTQ